MANAIAIRRPSFGRPNFMKPAPVRVVYRTPQSAKDEQSKLRTQISRLRGNMAGKADTFELLLSVAVGTAVSGAMDAWELDDIFGLDARLAVGGMCIAAGLFLFAKSRMGNLLVGFGVGLAAPAINDMVDELLVQMRKEAA